MCVLEALGVLQTKAKKAVKPNVGKPDQRGPDQGELLQQGSEAEHQEGEDKAVEEVVDKGSNPWSCKVACKGNVR